jgi:hypothetical protein
MSEATLNARLLIANHTLKVLLSQISQIEADQKMSSNEKLSQIKKIREEITKVGTEIDSIKREFTLLNSYSIN